MEAAPEPSLEVETDVHGPADGHLGHDNVEIEAEGGHEEGALAGGEAEGTSATLAPSTTEGRSVSAGSSEPKQTSLARWLL